MDNIGHSAADSATTATTSTARDHYLRQLNKLSHKISKPPSGISAAARPSLEPHDSNQQSHLQQPPVYNISRNDFREVVQKLTGSPAHERLASPPPIQPSKPPSSRLQRIRPPPLAQLINRPPPLLNCTDPQNQNPNNLTNQIQISSAANSNLIGRSASPLSPLPPLPAVHAAAESPVSAYMRYLQSYGTGIESKPYHFTGFSPLAPLVPFPPPPPPQFNHPLSPLPFGRLNSPKSPYPLLFSPTSGFPQFPLSPTVPVPSPKGGTM